MMQLNPSIPVSTPVGNGYAFMVIDYGEDHHLLWTVAIDQTGEIWTYSNPHVRVRPNVTMDAPRGEAGKHDETRSTPAVHQ
jgi:hypothetical protein